jgi:anti-sigma B factor antagonist
MEITTKDINEIKVIQFQGHLDSNTSQEAEKFLNDLLGQQAKKILVNFEKLDYISSAGLRVLLSTSKQLKIVDGKLRLCNLNETVQEIFDMSGFSTILEVFKTEPQALEGF